MLERGEQTRSRRLLEESVRVDPGFVSPYNILARLTWEQGDTAGAIAWLQRALAVDPDSWRSRRNLGMMLADLERADEAEPHLTRARDLFEEDLGVRLTLARVLYAQRKFEAYAEKTRRALAVGGRWGQPLADVRSFLESFERGGPGLALPPTSAPRVLLGWNNDQPPRVVTPADGAYTA